MPVNARLDEGQWWPKDYAGPPLVSVDHELAEAVGLSPTPCSRRVKRLEDSGIIRGHVTLLNQPMLGLKLTAYIGITMDRHTPDRFEAFETIAL